MFWGNGCGCDRWVEFSVLYEVIVFGVLLPSEHAMIATVDQLSVGWLLSWLMAGGCWGVIVGQTKPQKIRWD